MKAKLFVSVLIVCCFSSVIFPQVIRTSSMAGITLPLKDEDNSLNPYDMAGNISWLYLDETVSFLKISPSFNSNWGDYKRTYDAEKTDLYGINFTGLKTLGIDGTFLGKVTYLYDARSDVNRSIKYNTYKGEAFFVNDSSCGNIRYTGPAVNFAYSFELFDGVYLGAGAGYKILKGLKEIYSQSSTTLRNVDGTAGLTYRISDDLFLSGGFSIYSSQESITSASSNTIDIELFTYHGETFSFSERGPSLTENLKEMGYSWSSQFYYKPDEGSEAGINFNYSNSNQRLFPKVNGSGSNSDFEDGYSAFNDFLIEGKGRYDLSEDLTAGIKAFYSRNSCWSKLSAQNLLLWNWQLKSFGGGIGGSYKIIPSLTFNFQYDYSYVNGDSSKYIDHRFSEVASGDHIIRVGGEYEMFQNLFVRGGYAAGMIEKDIVYGGSNIRYDLFTFGVGINLLSTFSIDLLLEYNNYKPKQLDFSRNKFNALASIKLFNI